MNDTETLTDTERGILLTRCECGHTINDHGSIGGCWLCLDDGRPDCAHDFEDLLAVRVARVVAARVAAARADALAPVLAVVEDWEGWARGRSTTRIDAFRDAAETIRAAVAVPEPEDTRDGWQQRALEAGHCTPECPAQIHHHGKHEDQP